MPSPSGRRPPDDRNVETLGLDEEGEDVQRLRLGALAAEKLQTALETLIPKE